MADDPTDRELLWRQYSLWLDLYKFHLDIVLKANAFFYLITGGILAFYFAHPEQRLIKWSLLLPIFMSLALAFAFAFGARLVVMKSTILFDITHQLNFKTPPDLNVLTVLLGVGAALFFVVAISLFILLIT